MCTSLDKFDGFEIQIATSGCERCHGRYLIDANFTDSGQRLTATLNGEASPLAVNIKAVSRCGLGVSG